jgi:hypothetical protein
MLRRIFGLTGEEAIGGSRNYIMRSFIICISPQLLLG